MVYCICIHDVTLFYEVDSQTFLPTLSILETVTFSIHTSQSGYVKTSLFVALFMFLNVLFFIAVCIYRYVITFGLHGKYDVDGHYFRFAARILANPHSTSRCYVRYTYRSCIVCKHLIYIGGGRGNMYCSTTRV